jgi:hypothetical protein
MFSAGGVNGSWKVQNVKCHGTSNCYDYNHNDDPSCWGNRAFQGWNLFELFYSQFIKPDDETLFLFFPLKLVEQLSALRKPISGGSKGL